MGYIYHDISYIASNYLSYDWKFVTFDHSSNSPSSTSANHKPDLFFYELDCFWSIIDLQHDVSSWYTA